MTDLVGQNLGQYQIIEAIGAGGMATVYKAYQPGLDRHVAVKVLPPQHAMAEGFEQRFFREAKAVAQLNHPNILPIYDVGIEKEVSYFVMKYVPGRTLGDLMGKPMSLERVSRFVDQIAGALDHAHGRGILHRDIKPANMLLDEDDWLLLADFGLAKIVEGSEQLTATGISMGTPSYASPEQVEGMHVDHRTDIYSLGIVLYQMVTGELPYQGNTPMSIMFKHVHEDLPDPRSFVPDLPEQAVQVIRIATAKHYEERYNRAGDLASAFRQSVGVDGADADVPDKQGTVILPDTSPESTVALDDDSDNAAGPAADPHATMYMRDDPPKTRPGGLVQVIRKNIVAVAIIALLLLAGLGAFIWYQMGQGDQSALAQQFEQEFKNAPDNGSKLRALSNLFELEGYNAQGRALFNGLSAGEQASLLENVPSDAQDQLRTVVQGVYSEVENNQAGNSLLANMQSALNQSGDADSKSLANEIDNWLKGRAAAAQGDNEAAEIAYSVAIGLNSQNPATYFERAKVRVEMGNYEGALSDFEAVADISPDWQPRVKQAVEGNYDLHVWLWNVRERYQAVTALVTRPADTPTPTVPPTNTPEPTQTPTPQPTATPTSTQTPTPQPTDTPTPQPAAAPAETGGFTGGPYQLVFTKWDGGQHNLYVADTNGENEQFLLNRAAGPSWSGDGNYIFFYGEAGVDRQNRGGVDYVFEGISNGIVRLNADPLPATVDDIQVFQDSGWNEGSARWTNVSPNGQVVAYDARPGGGYRIYFIGTADGQRYPYEISGEQGDWSPDGEQIVYRSGRDGKTGIWVSNWNDTGHTNLTNNGSDSFPAWSPNGQTIAFSRDQGGNVDIYTINVDGSNLQRLTEAPGPDTLPVYTPGGDIIFRSARGGSWGIWKMTGSGARQTEIIPNAGVGPDWAFSKMDVK